MIGHRQISVHDASHIRVAKRERRIVTVCGHGDYYPHGHRYHDGAQIRGLAGLFATRQQRVDDLHLVDPARRAGVPYAVATPEARASQR